jgi:branched-subunit amino acid transport protein
MEIAWAIVAAWVAWLVYRRSLRALADRAAARALAEKLLDRIASSADLIEFVRTAEGRALMNVPHGAPPNARKSALRFIQAGILAAGVGMALLWNASRLRGATDLNLVNEQRLILYWASAGLAVGLASIVAGIASYALARRWGLLAPVTD